MKKDSIQCINRFACDSALGQGPGADEGLHRSHCRSAGRPICSGRIESRYSGGLNGNRIMKIESMDQGWRAPGAERISIDLIVVPANKPYGIDSGHKIIYHPISREVV
ncbi:MAG: hypothetical protein PHS80_02720 [Methanothrix sp.]|nr:hypothetical protein [Methanothrix sp.]